MVSWRRVFASAQEANTRRHRQPNEGHHLTASTRLRRGGEHQRPRRRRRSRSRRRKYAPPRRRRTPLATFVSEHVQPALPQIRASPEEANTAAVSSTTRRPGLKPQIRASVEEANTRLGDGRLHRPGRPANTRLRGGGEHGWLDKEPAARKYAPPRRRRTPGQNVQPGPAPVAAITRLRGGGEHDVEAVIGALMLRAAITRLRGGGEHGASTDRMVRLEPVAAITRLRGGGEHPRRTD